MGLQQNSPQLIPQYIVSGYTGYNINNPSGGVNVQQLSGGIAAVGVGVGLIYLGKWLARAIR